MNQQIPTHINSSKQNQTLYWSGSDCQTLWEKNMNIPKFYDYLKRMKWDNDQAIEYKFNSHGFREDNFDQRDNHLAIGCSFTEGVGLRKDQIWPSKLTNLIGNHVWNLGIGGASADTCFRILNYYIKMLKPKSVFLLIPPLMRLELHSSNGVDCYLPTSTNVPFFIKQWMYCEDNGNINRYKNILAMKQLCADQNIKLYTQGCERIRRPSKIDLARDLIHYGEETQEYFATSFYKDYINNLV